MESDIFKAGVRPGGLTSHNEIKMLICYLLSSIGTAMTFEQLHTALEENDLVNYFELVQVIEGLLKSGHIVADGTPEAYRATDRGREAAGEFEKALPLTVRERALQAADLLLRRQRREQEVRVAVEEAENGFYMQLAIPDHNGSLCSFSLFLPTKEECELVRRRFLNDPVFVYKGVMALLTGDREVLGRIFPPQEELF